MGATGAISIMGADEVIELVCAGAVGAAGAVTTNMK